MSAVDLKTRFDMADEKDVAELLNITLGTLRNQRSRGDGPPFERSGKRVLYPIKELRKFLAARRVTPKKQRTLVDGRGKRSAG